MNYVSDSAGITIPSDLSCGHYFGTLDHESLSLILSAIAIEKKFESPLRSMHTSSLSLLRFHPPTEVAGIAIMARQTGYVQRGYRA